MALSTTAMSCRFRSRSTFTLCGCARGLNLLAVHYLSMTFRMAGFGIAVRFRFPCSTARALPVNFIRFMKFSVCVMRPVVFIVPSRKKARAVGISETIAVVLEFLPKLGMHHGEACNFMRSSG
eukprot:IDg16876t1